MNRYVFNKYILDAIDYVNCKHTYVCNFTTRLSNSIVRTIMYHDRKIVIALKIVYVYTLAF